jgi:type IV pilus assembly protein PilC
MLFNYEVLDEKGEKKMGSIDAINVDVAISSLQRRGLVLASIKEANGKNSFLNSKISIFDRVSGKEIVILSRQLATLFQAQVSALRIFRLLSGESENNLLRNKLNVIADDLQSGSSISTALEKHPKIFSEFYTSMVKTGEESGKLDQVFEYLASYLDRSYELTSKVRGALIYPAFVVVTFITVMILMFTMVIPKISGILTESGTALPIYTTVILGVSNFLVEYGFVILTIALVLGFFAVRFIRTPNGRLFYDQLKLQIPYLSTLFKKLYLSRLADNMNTMLSSGIPIVRALELTSNIIYNKIYQAILVNSMSAVKGGKTLSESLSNNPHEIPGIMVQMTRVGEETGEVGTILKTLADFYTREVRTAVDSLVSLIEPVMIVMLGGGVAVLLASVLVPIYNIAGAQ